MDLRYAKIKLLIDQSRFPEAEAAIREHLAEEIDDAYAFVLLAISQLRQNRPRQAEEAARQAISLEPDSDFAFYILAAILLERKKPKEGLTAIREALKLDPYDAEYFALQGRLLFDLSKQKEALESLDAGLALDPENETCRFFRSIILGKMGREEEADQESVSLLSDGPEDADNHCARGWVLLQAGDGTGAERHFVEALRITPENADARMGLVQALKLKNPLAGWLLRFLMWMDRFPWWVVLCGAVTVQWLSTRLLSSEAEPLILAGNALKVLIYFVFAMILASEPLFNLVLMTTKTGRYALSDADKRGVRWALVPLVLGCVAFGIWALRGPKNLFPYEAIAWLSVAKLVNCVFDSPLAWVRRRMAAIAALAVLIAVSIEVAVYGYLLPRTYEFIKGLADAEPSEEQAEAIKEGIKHLFNLRIWIAYVPTLVLWIFAAWSEDLLNWLHRHAPDEEENV